jgi:hypothetical protein
MWDGALMLNDDRCTATITYTAGNSPVGDVRRCVLTSDHKDAHSDGKFVTWSLHTEAVTDGAA